MRSSNEDRWEYFYIEGAWRGAFIQFRLAAQQFLIVWRSRKHFSSSQKNQFLNSSIFITLRLCTAGKKRLWKIHKKKSEKIWFEGGREHTTDRVVALSVTKIVWMLAKKNCKTWTNHIQEKKASAMTISRTNTSSALWSFHITGEISHRIAWMNFLALEPRRMEIYRWKLFGSTHRWSHRSHKHQQLKIVRNFFRAFASTMSIACLCVA